MAEQDSINHGVLMKEVSDFKVLMAVNNTETTNIKNSLGKIEIDIKETKQAVQIANGRTTKLEEWSKESQKVIDNTTKIASETYNNYKTDKTRIWAVLGVMLFLGGTIITLSIMAINSKIRDGISEALSKFDKIEITDENTEIN